MTDYINHGRLDISNEYHSFVEKELLPELGISAETYWSNLETLLQELSPENEKLLATRENLQNQLDKWHQENPGPIGDTAAYKTFLNSIGYLNNQPISGPITSVNIDPEIAHIAGPQLVVPIDNARYALNAANARWGSLFDAVYGTDALGSVPMKKLYDPIRGEQVISWCKAYLDGTFPLEGTSYNALTGWQIRDGQLYGCIEGSAYPLKNPNEFVGYRGNMDEPSVILLKKHDLHLELHIDRNHSVGKCDPAGLKDIIAESALTSIMDFEDSVASVAPYEKVGAYRNWLGLMKGDLTANFTKFGKQLERKLADDRHYTAKDGSELRLRGRAVMLARNVGHLTRHSAVLLDGEPVFEGLLDALTTSTIALYDLRGPNKGTNSATGSVYIVKPKMHGPDEVDFACRTLERVEQMLELPRATLKIGIMDEERRTSANLGVCIDVAKERVFFINTGFLDRTGDEIHSTIYAGPYATKAEIKSANWIQAYEDRNLAWGLQTGFRDHAQIGKGMWPMPDKMADMLDQKIAHPRTGASTAWVPSPTAATLHAIHYHSTNVNEIQRDKGCAPRPVVDTLFDLALLNKNKLTDEDIQTELERNAQSILGYVVRWIDQGVGCSKVPDIDHVGLMEDRATLRISSQLIANWLLHKIVSEDQVKETFARMARMVDLQNAGDSNYQPMTDNLKNSIAFQAALELALDGINQPSGYTEPVLIRRRTERLKQLGKI